MQQQRSSRYPYGYQGTPTGPHTHQAAAQMPGTRTALQTQQKSMHPPPPQQQNQQAFSGTSPQVDAKGAMAVPTAAFRRMNLDPQQRNPNPRVLGSSQVRTRESQEQVLQRPHTGKGLHPQATLPMRASANALPNAQATSTSYHPGQQLSMPIRRDISPRQPPIHQQQQIPQAQQRQGVVPHPHVRPPVQPPGQIPTQMPVQPGQTQMPTHARPQSDALSQSQLRPQPRMLPRPHMQPRPRMPSRPDAQQQISGQSQPLQMPGPGGHASSSSQPGPAAIRAAAMRPSPSTIGSSLQPPQANGMSARPPMLYARPGVGDQRLPASSGPPTGKAGSGQSTPTAGHVSRRPHPQQGPLPPQSTSQRTQSATTFTVPRPCALEPPCGTPRFYYQRGLPSPDQTHSGAPLTNSDFITVDDGSATVRYMRLTTGAVPSDPALYAKSAVPLAVLLTPFAAPAPGESLIPVMNYARNPNDGPLRCSRCNAYGNPGFRFTSGGSQYECNLCGQNSSTPPEHYSALSPATGLRLDADSRLEFSHGSVEYIVGHKDYCLRPPKPALYVFVLDVSAAAIQSGLSHCAAVSIQSALSAGLLTGTDAGARVGIMTYNDKLHFYDARGESVTLQCVPDVEDPFVPIGGEAFGLTPSQAVKAIDQAIAIHGLNPLTNGQISEKPKSYQQGNCLGAALHSLKSVMKDCGGKVFVVGGGLPSVGISRLERRGGGRGGGEEREMALLKPANSEWELLGAELAECQCSVDMFLANLMSYVDTSTLMQVCRMTGGRTWLFNNWDAARDSAALHRGLCKAASSVVAFEALMRVRLSVGMEPVGEYYGHFGRPQHGDDVSGPVFDQESSLALEIAITSKMARASSGPNPGSTMAGTGFANGGSYPGVGTSGSDLHKEACIQCAVLFTDPVGTRRIRVHTIFPKKASAFGDLFQYGDVDATVAFMAKKAATSVLKEGLSLTKARNSLIEKCAQSLFVYRKYCTTAHSAGQLVLPESIKTLPAVCLGLMKSTAFRDVIPSSQDPYAVSVDERAAALYFLTWAMPSSIAVYGYPRMYDFSVLPEAAGEPLKKGSDVPVTNGSTDDTSNRLKISEPIALPNSVGLSSAFLNSSSVILIENAMKMVLWIGDQANKDLVESIVVQSQHGRLSVRAETGGSAELTKSIDIRGKRIAKIIRRILGARTGLTEVATVVRQAAGQGGEARHVLPLLIEDRHSNGVWSYLEFLKHLHRRVMDKFEHESSQREMQNWEMFNHGY